MGIKQIIFFVGFLIFAVQTFAQTSFERHTVQKGETIYSISKQHGISEKDLIKYNPDIATTLRVGSVLVVPKSNRKQQASAPEPPLVKQDFAWHTVQPKETMYGLCKQYNCTEEELLKLNPDLKDGLKIGAQIRVPTKTVKTEVPTDSVNFIYHLVEPKETVYSICRAANITEAEFLKLNPEVRLNGLQINQTIKLPKENIIAVKEDVPSDTPPKRDFGLYRILPDDDLVIIAAKFNATVEEIIRLNPEMAYEITVGKYIVVPEKKALVRKVVPTKSVENIFWNVPEMGAKPKVHYALCLPLYLTDEEINDSSIVDISDDGLADKSKIALQFLAGFKLAMDTLANLGYEIEIDIYDTRNDLETTRQIARTIDRSVDAVIGPLHSQNAEILASMLPSITVISPLSKKLENQNLPNLVNGMAGLNSEYLAMARLLNKHAQKSKVLFINSDTEENRKVVKEINNFMYATDTNAYQELWVNEKYEQLKYLSDHLNLNTTNVLVVVDQDAAFISDLMTKVYNRRDTAVFILATSKLFAINTLENQYLNNQRFAGLNATYVDYADTVTQMFIQKYRLETATEPNKFGFCGYDIGLYFTHVIASYGTLPAEDEWPRVQGVERGFSFAKYGSAGAQNQFVYTLQMLNYKLERVE